MIAEVDTTVVPLICTFDELTAELIAEQLAAVIVTRSMMAGFLMEDE